MECYSILVEVVQDSNTELVTLTVVRLTTSGASSVGPANILIAAARGPGDTTVPYITASPEILLSFLSNKTLELVLFGRAVNTDGLHTITSAITGSA